MKRYFYWLNLLCMAVYKLDTFINVSHFNFSDPLRSFGKPLPFWDTRWQFFYKVHRRHSEPAFASNNAAPLPCHGFVMSTYVAASILPPNRDGVVKSKQILVLKRLHTLRIARQKSGYLCYLRKFNFVAHYYAIASYGYDRYGWMLVFATFQHLA